MKKIVVAILATITLISCSETKKNKEALKTSSPEIFKCTSTDFKSIEAQADSISKFYNLAKNLKPENRIEINKKLFCAFPESFANMQAMFGFNKNNETSAAPLYDIPFDNNMITYFRDLNSIPKDIYYEKYINICVNGNWQGDNIRAAFGLDKRLVNDTKAICSSLALRTDDEITSVFCFIFDGPHPKNERNEKIYQAIFSKVKGINENLSILLTNSYTKIINEEYSN